MAIPLLIDCDFIQVTDLLPNVLLLKRKGVIADESVNVETINHQLLYIHKAMVKK